MTFEELVAESTIVKSGYDHSWIDMCRTNALHYGLAAYHDQNVNLAVNKFGDKVRPLMESDNMKRWLAGVLGMM